MTSAEHSDENGEFFIMQETEYVYDPQAADNATGNEAKELLVEGAVVYVVERRGVDADTDFTAGDRVRVHHLRVGAQIPSGDLTDEKARATCGRCGAYRDLHPTRWCEKSRHSFWWDEHYAWRHVAAWLWLRLSDRRRMDLVHRYWSRHKHLCWCEFVDAALLDDKREDYADDLCDVPLPFGVGEPSLGRCYCSPVNALRQPPAC